MEAYDTLIALRSEGREPYIGAAIEAYIGRGMAHLELDEHHEAILDFDRARTLAGEFLEAALLMGKAYCLAREMDRAERTFDALYEGANDDERNEAALWIAGVYYSVKDYEKGLCWTDRLGEDVAVRERLRSYFLLRGGENEKAIEAGREAIQRNERDPVAHLVLAAALSREIWHHRGPELFEAFRVATKAVELNPGDASAQKALNQVEAGFNHFIRSRVVKTLSSTPGLSRIVPVLAMLATGSVDAQMNWVPDAGNPIDSPFGKNNLPSVA